MRYNLPLEKMTIRLASRKRTSPGRPYGCCRTESLKNKPTQTHTDSILPAYVNSSAGRANKTRYTQRFAHHILYIYYKNRTQKHTCNTQLKNKS